jgi:ketosteroid isomerase-like protein
MGRHFGGVLAIVALVAGVGRVSADEATVRREIEAQYAGLAKANEAFDLKAVLTFRTPDFHSVGPDGRVLDAETMAEYSKRFQEDNKPPLRARFTVRAISISPNEKIAVVTVFQEVSRQRELAGKLRTVETNVVQDETWVKTDKGWLLKSVANVRDQTRVVDGKRVDPTKPYDPNAAPFDPDADRRRNLLGLKAEVAAASARSNSVGLTAWKLRDPDLFMTNVSKDLNVKKADGTVITWDSLYENQKQRMRTIKHIDRLIVTIRVESVSETEAVVLSTQDWSRVVPGPDGKDVRLVTGVTHREVWQKADGQWKMLKFTEENPTREIPADATIKDPMERYEIVVRLDDSANR